jgi:urease accessory protein
MDNFLSLLQFADGLFPAGAYAHSFGLEYYVQSSGITDAAGMEDFLRAYLEGSVAPTDTVAVLCALRAGKTGDLASCIGLDEMLDAMKTAGELREASRQMGRQMLRVVNHLSRHSSLE